MNTKEHTHVKEMGSDKYKHLNNNEASDQNYTGKIDQI